jgi:uncharacterized membrane-anchored protein YhcB (DUF1043 family)
LLTSETLVESINSFWLVVVAAFAAGCAIGALVFGTMSRGSKDAKKLKAELEEKEQELQAYKSSVAGHFNKTSELVNELTQDYVKVYKHLSEGARNLGGPRDDMNLLEQQQGGVLINIPETGDVSETEDLTPSETDGPVVDEEPGTVDDASREYISETIKEAADIAGQIDDKAAPTAATDPTGESVLEPVEEKKTGIPR